MNKGWNTVRTFVTKIKELIRSIALCVNLSESLDTSKTYKAGKPDLGLGLSTTTIELDSNWMRVWRVICT